MHVRGVWPRLASPYPAASILALCLASGADIALSKRVPDLGFVLFLLGLLLGLGALHGLIVQGLMAAVRWLPRRLGLAYWPIIAITAGMLLADRLGAFDRLGGRYRNLAILVLGVCSVGGVLLGSLISLMQPSERWPEGYLAGRPLWLRIAASVALLGAGAAAFAADRRMHADLYPDAHTALRLCGFWVAMFGFALADRELRLPRPSPALALLVAGWTAVPLVMLEGRNLRALQEFALRPWPSLALRTARALFDVDGDGYAAVLGGGDCAPFDARVHPSAREVPDNGIDDNCVLGDARRTVEKAETLPAPKDASPIDIVLITVDSLRPDHTGVYRPAEYGARGRGTTPNLDKWAEHATVFRNAYSSGGWTSVTLPSLMRGLYPRRLQWTYYFETNYFAMIRRPLEPKLRPGEVAERTYPLAFGDPHPPLAQRLSHRGMYTAAVLDDGYSEIFTKGIGADIGFDTYYETDRQGKGRRGDATTVDLALGVMRRIKKTKRFFMWVHLFGVHGPDEFHEGARIYGDTPVDRYDHEVSGLDLQLNRLLEAIDERKSPVAVFITADHGDVIEPPPRNHGLNLNEEVIRVPLIAKVPGWAPARVESLASVLDIVPTVLALTQTPAPSGLDGIDLAQLVESDTYDSRLLLSETWQFDVTGRRILDLVAAYDARHKVVLDRIKDYMLFTDRDRPRSEGYQISAGASDTLSRAINGFLDETGGEIRLAD